MAPSVFNGCIQHYILQQLFLPLPRCGLRTAYTDSYGCMNNGDLPFYRRTRHVPLFEIPTTNLLTKTK